MPFGAMTTAKPRNCHYYDNHCLLFFLSRLVNVIYTDADNILFLRYEDMKKDLPGAVRTISQFMGYDLDQSQIESIADQSTFEKMKANPMANPDNSKYAMHFKEDAGSFMRKGVIGDWKNHFSDEQSARFDTEFARRMAGSGLEQLASY